MEIPIPPDNVSCALITPSPHWVSVAEVRPVQSPPTIQFNLFRQGHALSRLPSRTGHQNTNSIMLTLSRSSGPGDSFLLPRHSSFVGLVTGQSRRKERTTPV